VLIECCIAFSDNSDHYLLDSALEKVAEVQRVLDDLMMKATDKTEFEVYQPLHDLLRDEFKEVKNQKAHYEKVRLDLDASISKLNNLKNKKGKEQKAKEVEVEVNAKRNNFDATAKQTAAVMKDTLTVAEAELTDDVCRYLEIFREYFLRADRILTEFIPELNEYKRQIETQRQKLNATSSAQVNEKFSDEKKKDDKKAEPKLLEKSQKAEITQKAPPTFQMNKSNERHVKSSSEENKMTKAQLLIFGQPLDEVVKREGMVSGIPAIIDKGAEVIEQKGLNVEGLFRVSPDLYVLNNTKNQINSTGIVDFSGMDPLLVASIMRLFLSELPEPLFTFNAYSKLLELNQITSPQEKMKKTQGLMDTLPNANRRTIRRLILLLNKIAQNSATNKMTPLSLATVLAPTILYPSQLPENPKTAFLQTQAAADILTYMITNAMQIFAENPNAAKTYSLQLPELTSTIASLEQGVQSSANVAASSPMKSPLSIPLATTTSSLPKIRPQNESVPPKHPPPNSKKIHPSVPSVAKKEDDKRIQPKENAPQGALLDLMQSFFTIPYSECSLGKELGEGRYGRVCLGKWKGTLIALKFCRNDDDIDEFLKEAQIMITIPPHPNIVQTFGITYDGPKPAIVMEYCAEGSLDKLLFDQSTPLPEGRILKIVQGIASGMYHLHRNNVVHRDLAARNILLTPSGDPKITDFGLSRILRQDLGRTLSSFGPIRWMAPESITRREYSQKSDVWSFGIVLYEIVARREPHADKNPNEVADLIGQNVMTPEIPNDCPPLYRDIMELCWKKDPQQRPSFDVICEMLKK
jgi:predicted Ser/Thr protein kinase